MRKKTKMKRIKVKRTKRRIDCLCEEGVELEEKDVGDNKTVFLLNGCVSCSLWTPV